MADPVVEEIDIISHTTAPHRLHKFVHPLRPAGRAVKTPSSVRVRPSRNTWQAEYAVDAMSEHFDPRALDDARMKSIKQRGEEVPLKAAHFMGVFDAGALHLHPVHSIQMLRPDLSYLDTHEEAGKPAQLQPVKVTAQFRRTDERAVVARRTSYAYLRQHEEAEEFVTLKTHGSQSEESRAFLELLKTRPEDVLEAADLEAQQRELEAACAPAFLPDAAAVYLQNLTAGGAPVAALPTTVTCVTPINVVRAAAAAAASSHFRGPSAPLQPVAMAEMLTRPLTLQVEELLRRVVVMPTARVVEFCTPGVPPAELFTALTATGRLVAGNWVLRSDLAYLPHWTVRMAQQSERMDASMSRGPQSGAVGAAATAAAVAQQRGRSVAQPYELPAAVYSRAVPMRDYVLVCLMVHGYVRATHVAAVTGTTRRALQGMLRRVCVSDVEDRDVWRLKCQPDAEFTSFFPTLAATHEAWWAARSAELVVKYRDTATEPVVVFVPSAGRAPGAADISSMAALPDDAAAFRQLAARTPARGRQVDAAGVAGAPTPAGAASSASTGSAGGHATSVGSASTSNWSNCLVPVAPHELASAMRARLPPVQFRTLKTFVAQELAHVGLVSKVYLATKLQSDASAGDSPAQGVIAAVAACTTASSSTDASPAVGVPAQRALLAAVEAALQDTSLHVHGRDAYVSASISAAVDRYRAPIVHAFLQKGTLRRKDVYDAVHSALGEELPGPVFTRFVKDIAESHGTVWHMKSGNPLAAGAPAGAGVADGHAAL